MPVSTSGGPVVATVVAVAVLVLVNLLNNRFAPTAYLPTSLLATALLLAVFRWGGGRWADAGLARAGLDRGLRWAVALTVLIAAAYLVLALLPATRSLFLDRRVSGAGAGAAAYQVLLRIPLGTALLEEVAFRGVLYGLIRVAYGTVPAVVVSSLLFGLWHVLPSWMLPRLNPAAEAAFGGSSGWMVLAAVAATALAGVLLCEIRRSSGGLLAPLAVHWAVNAFAYLTAWLVTRGR